MGKRLDSKYEKADLNKVMAEQCQKLSQEECRIILSLLKIFQDMFDGALGMWNYKPVNFK